MKTPEKPKKTSRREFLKSLPPIGYGLVFGYLLKTLSTTQKEKELEEKIRNLEEERIRELESLKKELEKLEKEKREILKNELEKIKILEVEATAYTSGPESTGKKPGDVGYGITYSGLPANIGTIAVDPNVIPLGSIIYVPGYGYGIATDTGSAIKGNKIDLYFHDVNQALKWGRKKTKIIVLGDLDYFKNRQITQRLGDVLQKLEKNEIQIEDFENILNKVKQIFEENK